MGSTIKIGVSVTCYSSPLRSLGKSTFLFVLQGPTKRFGYNITSTGILNATETTLPASQVILQAFNGVNKYLLSLPTDSGYIMPVITGLAAGLNPDDGIWELRIDQNGVWSPLGLID